MCIALIFVVNCHARSKTQRRLWQLTLAAIFGFVFWQRIASGGHFTSDAILAALITALVMAILVRVWPQTR
jgi:pantothenate kinase